MSSSKKTTTQSKSTRKVQVTRTVTKTGPDGKVVTETFTDYKEINDDSDASGFGSGFDSKFSSFPDFDSSFKSSNSKALQPSSTSSFQKSNPSTKSSSSSSSSSEDEDDFEEDALKKHNEYRQKHGCAPLKLDKKVIFLSSIILFCFPFTFLGKLNIFHYRQWQL